MNKNAFTLIEIIIATGILSISVFGVFKLISENNKIIDNSNKYLNSTLLISVIENCIENTGINASRYFDLGSDLKQCNPSGTEILNEIDNIYYSLFARLLESDSDKNIWEVELFSEFSGKIVGNYIQKK